MGNVFSRPLFRGKFIQRYAQGGIVSTVMGPEEANMDPMKILSDMAEQTDATEKNLDAAGNIDEIIGSFSGDGKDAATARSELAELVGAKDAEATPDSVLALVQPTMAILEMSRQMQPPGGIADVPMMPPGAEGAPPMDPTVGGLGAMTPESPLPKFATGMEVDVNAITNKYNQLQQAVPANYGADPASAWLALAQFGAGLAQGKTFAQGLSLGTAQAGPYMQSAIENKNRRRDALTAYVAEEAARQEAAAARSQELADSQAFDLKKIGIENQNQRDLITLQDRLKADDTDREERQLNQLRQKRLILSELPEDDPQRAIVQQDIKDLESILMPEASKTDPYANARAIVAANGGDPNDLSEIGKAVIWEKSLDKNKSVDVENGIAVATGEGLTPGTAEFNRRVGEYILNAKKKDDKSYADIVKAEKIAELRQTVRDNPTDQNAKDQLDALEKDSSGINVNIDTKAGYNLSEEFRKRKDEKYIPAQDSRAKQLEQVQVMKQISEIDPSKGGFEQGLFPQQRIFLGQLAQSFGYDPGELSKFLSGPEFGSLFDTTARQLSLEQQKDMARGTNLTLQIIQEANANSGKNKETNKLWLDIQEKSLKWEQKNDDYLSLLERFYGTDDPSALKRIKPDDPAVQGLDIPMKPLAKLSEDEIFSADGRPLLSYDSYVQWRRLHEPAIDNNTRQLLMSYAKVPTGKDGFKLPTIPGQGPSATPPATVKDFVETPGVNLNNDKPGTVPNNPPPIVQVPGETELFKYDLSSGYYVGTKTGRKIDPVTRKFVAPTPTAPR